jgi:hypothetical protein
MATNSDDRKNDQPTNVANETEQNKTSTLAADSAESNDGQRSMTTNDSDESKNRQPSNMASDSNENKSDQPLTDTGGATDSSKVVVDAEKTEENVPDSSLSNAEYDGCRIPAWFLTHNVQVAEELLESETQIDLKTRMPNFAEGSKHEDEIQAGELHCRKYELHYDEYSELRDITNGALLSDNLLNQYQSQQPSILIKAPLDAKIDFLESILKQLARDVGANLISVDLEDLADLAANFSRQDELQTETPSLYSLVETYFGIPCEDHAEYHDQERNEEAVSAILSAPELKSKTRQLSSRIAGQNPPESYPPTFLHIRDAKQIMGLEMGKKIMKTFRARVQGHREIGKSVVPFASVLQSLASEKEDSTTRELSRKILVDPSVIIDLVPSKCTALFGTDEAHRTGEINVRKLKRALGCKLRDGFSAGLLDPHTPWDRSKVDPISTHLGTSIWPDNTVERVARRIIGRLRSKSALELDDICEAIAMHISYAKGKSPNLTDNLATVKKSCNQFEKALLDCVVHRGNGYSDKIV